MPLSRKIAYIDLDKKSARIEAIPIGWRKARLGGRGINTYLLYKYTSKDTQPFDGANPLIFGAGLFAGLPGFGVRINISGKSPESGYLGDSNMGGDFASELAFAGLHHLLITSASSEPAYIFIDNGRIEFKDASRLWGLDSVETQRRIRQELKDDKVQVACIGQAGENLVVFAGVRTGKKNIAGRTGMGALMGSKKLKAVAVRGTRDIKVEEPALFLKSYAEYMEKLMGRKWTAALGRYGTPLLLYYSNSLGFISARNHQATTLGERGESLVAHELDKYSDGMLACYGCPVHCRHRFKIEGGRYKGTRGEGPEYASVGSLGCGLDNVDLENVLYATELCNLYGLDTISTGSNIAAAMELYQRGIIGKELTGIELKWGDPDAIIGMVHMIANRKGFGDMVARGVKGFQSLGSEAAKYAFHIKNIPLEMTDERAVKSFAFGLATASRGCDHMRSRPSVDVVGFPREVLEGHYGASVDEDYRSYTGKARMVWWHELLYAVCDAIGFCRFQTAFSSLQAPKYEEFSQMILYATGLELSAQELQEAGERICATERSFLAREGLSRRDDTLPWRYFDERVADGPSKGEYIDRAKFQEMLDDYYSLHGWDEGGRPTLKTIKKLNIDNLDKNL